MPKNRTMIHTALDADELAVVDMYRQGIKCRTGKSPTRSTAVADLIRATARDVKIGTVRSYSNLLAALDDHEDRIGALEAHN